MILGNGLGVMVDQMAHSAASAKYVKHCMNGIFTMIEPLNDDQPSFDELISLSEAANFSGLSISYLRRLVTNGEIWGEKIGRNWVTTEIAVNEFLARDRKPGRKPKKN